MEFILYICPGQYLPLKEFRFKCGKLFYLEFQHLENFWKSQLLIKRFIKYFKNYMAKEDEINNSKKGIATFEPEKGKQEKTIKRCKDNYEILGFNSKVKRFATGDWKKTPGPDSYSNKNYRGDKSFEKKSYNNKTSIFKIICDRKSIFKVDKNDLYSLNFNRNACMRNLNKIIRLKIKLIKIIKKQLKKD